MNYRKCLIIAINFVFIAIWAIRRFYPPVFDTDFAGIFIGITLLFIALFDFYAFVLYEFFPKCAEKNSC